TTLRTLVVATTTAGATARRGRGDRSRRKSAAGDGTRTWRARRDRTGALTLRCRGRRAGGGRGTCAIANADGARHFGFHRGALALFCRGLCRFGLGASSFLETQRIHARGFLAGGFRGCRFTLGRGFRFSFSGRGGGCRLLFGGGLHVGGFAATADRRFAGGGGRRRGRDRRGFGGRRPTATCGRRRCGLLLGAHALFPLPAGANASDLIVGEHAHVAANGNVHGPKK